MDITYNMDESRFTCWHKMLYIYLCERMRVHIINHFLKKLVNTFKGFIYLCFYPQYRYFVVVVNIFKRIYTVLLLLVWLGNLLCCGYRYFGLCLSIPHFIPKIRLQRLQYSTSTTFNVSSFAPILSHPLSVLYNNVRYCYTQLNLGLSINLHSLHYII